MLRERGGNNLLINNEKQMMRRVLVLALKAQRAFTQLLSTEFQQDTDQRLAGNVAEDICQVFLK